VVPLGEMQQRHALADQMRRNDVVTACFFGDGAVAEGEFHETMNLAALWGVPVRTGSCCWRSLIWPAGRFHALEPVERGMMNTMSMVRS
jgi:hypothetical protein